MRVLLVEDDAALASALARALRAASFAVDIAENGIDGAHLGATESYDVAVLDVGLPSRDGLEILSEWRSNGITIPVLILTARQSWSDKVQGFKAGADDYLVKPVQIEELAMRLRALVRRALGHAVNVISCGPVTFESHTGQFQLHGMPLKLTALEWRILLQLTLRKEVTVERTELLERVYRADAEVDSNSLEVMIARLRRKIGAQYIETVRGRGYRLTGGE